MEDDLVDSLRKYAAEVTGAILDDPVGALLLLKAAERIEELEDQLDAAWEIGQGEDI
jgi:hypothetical protein